MMSPKTFNKARKSQSGIATGTLRGSLFYILLASLFQYIAARWIDEVGHVLHSQFIDEVRKSPPKVIPGCHTSYQQGGQLLKEQLTPWRRFFGHTEMELARSYS